MLRAVLPAIVLLSGVVGFVIWRSMAKPAPIRLEVKSSQEVERPIQENMDGYVSSQACRACHQAEFKSWHHSYHRTMTQVASPASVLGRFEGNVEHAGAIAGLFQRVGDEFRVELSEEHDGQTVSLNAPVVLTTGSHHMQIYWLAPPEGQNRQVSLLPFVYLKEANRWIPRTSAFLQSPAAATSSLHGNWNLGCIKCHTTHGVGNFGGKPFDSRVAEFGISCEACHGPGAMHVSFHESGSTDPALASRAALVNPATLPHDRRSQVCGQCHSLLRLKAELVDGYYAHGDRWRPGDDLLQSREMRTATDSTCWPDGMVRGGGREFGALLASPCYQRGELSCLSCHRLHQSSKDPRPPAEWANDQLRHDALDHQACLQCHTDFREQDRVARHTHHAPQSAGSECYNCHMPHTSYALLKAIRSHQIDSPDTKTSVAPVGRPNACNLCHLDKTLAWTANHLEEWYGISRPKLTGDERQISAALLWLLRGDAGQRSLAAWHMGWGPAQEASGTTWMAPFLAQLLDDPYDAVRYIAYRSLRGLPGFAEFEYDFVASQPEREAARQRAVQVWRQTPPKPVSDRQSLLLNTGRSLRTSELRRLLESRSNRPIELSE